MEASEAESAGADSETSRRAMSFIVPSGVLGEKEEGDPPQRAALSTLQCWLPLAAEDPFDLHAHVAQVDPGHGIARPREGTLRHGIEVLKLDA